MKKRLLSLVLVVCMVLAMCAPTALADTLRIDDHYPAPFDVQWNGYEMNWDWDGAEDAYFQGFEVGLYYNSSNPENEPDENSEWIYKGVRVFSTTPSLADFNVTETGWYSFAVCAYGQKDFQIEPANGSDPYWTTGEVTSPYSGMSAPVYFEKQEAVAAPTNLRWEGTTMIWDVASAANIDHFDVRPSYMTTDDNGDPYEDWITTGYVEAETGKANYSIDLEDMNVDEEWLLDNGSQTYYFKVQAVSNDVTVAASSDWVTGTATMTFNADAEKLSPPSNLRWEGYTMAWDLEEGMSYDVTLYFLRDLTQEEMDEIGAAGGSEEMISAQEAEIYRNISSAEDFPVLSNEVMWDRAGNYYFTVKTRSNDLSQYLSSDWSDASLSLPMDGRFSLPVPTDLGYDEETGAITWIWPATDAQAAVLNQFEIQLFYRADESAEPTQIAWLWSEGVTSTTEWKMHADKDGLYSFKVLAASDNWTIYDHSDWSDLGGEFYYDAPDPLPKPTGLTWNGSIATWDALTEKAEYVNRYYVTLYYCGIDGTDMQHVKGRSVRNDTTSYAFNEDCFNEYGAGMYEFRVRAESNDTNVVSNGEWAVSERFTYTPTDTKLPAPTNPRWEGQTMTWDVPDDTSDIACYEVQFYVPGSNSYSTNEVPVGEFQPLGQWYIQSMGDTIYFRVRAISNNVNEYCDSEFTVCEQTYEKPAGLPAPTNAAWNGTTMTWSWAAETDEQAAMQYRYFVVIYYSETANGETIELGRYGTRDSYMPLEMWGEAAEKDGFYSFAVIARSRDYSVIADSDLSERSAAIEYKVPEKLAVPTNVQWDGSVATWTASSDEASGLVDAYEVALYNRNGNIVWSRYCYDRTGRYAIPSEIFARYGAGNYTFGVRAISRDYAVRSNSAFVKSGTFAYTAPSVTLAAPANVGWNGMTMKWDAVTDGSVAAYEVQFYNPENADGYSSTTLAVGQYMTISQGIINRFGETIHFKVRALSANASVASDSAWAVCEQSYVVADPLPTPEVQWNGDVMAWTWSGTEEQEAALSLFRLEIYYAETADGTPTLVQGIGINRIKTDYSAWQQYATASGWYFFRICAYSGDTAVGSNSAWSAMSEGYQYEMADPLAPPTNLRWNGSTLEWDESESERNLIWRYAVRLYYCGVDGTDTPRMISDSGTGRTSFNFETDMFSRVGNGVYMATVCTQSNDYATASNSETVWSSAFTYANPGKRLEAPANLHWDGATMKWDVPEDTSGIAYYQVHVFAPGNENRGWGWTMDPGEFPALEMETVEDLGTTLTFSVYAVSLNANNASDSSLAYCKTNYTFTEPEPLDAPANLTYDVSGQLTWDLVEGADEYRIFIYYAESRDADLVLYDTWYMGPNGRRIWFDADEPGLYVFKVQAISNSLSHGDSVFAQCEYYYDPNLPQLDAPNDLKWGKDYGYHWDEEQNEWIYGYEEVPGIISWKRGETTQSEYQIRYYKVGNDEPIWQMRCGYGSMNVPDYLSEFEFLLMDQGSGTYYFTVQAIGDKINYRSSEVAVSDEWTYIKPASALAAPTDPTWDGDVMTWKISDGEENYYGVEAEISFSKTLDGEREVVGHHRTVPFDTELKIDDWYLQTCGSGYFWFRVRAMSSDINAQTISGWSELSDAYRLAESVENVNQELESIISTLPEITEDTKEEEKAAAAEKVNTAVEQVKAMETKDLANAMAADQRKGGDIEEGGTLALIQKLEEQLEATGGATSEVAVNANMANTFDTNSVSVVGAALNADENTEKVALEIGAPSENVPGLNETMYTSTVQFSMHLANEKGEKITTDGGELDIPVRITLPVPTNINPAFLVVLHYHADGTYEEILPYVYRDGNKWFASFVVTSFSDFALAAVTIDAEVVGEGVRVTATFAAELEGSAVCAVYDADGKLLGTTVLDSMTAGEHELIVACDGSKAATAKLFVLDGSSVPMYVESPCVVKK